MNERPTETTIKTCIMQIRIRLEHATSIANAAHICAETGNAKKALEIALDIEEPIHEASTLLNAASILNRTHKN